MKPMQISRRKPKTRQTLFSNAPLRATIEFVSHTRGIVLCRWNFQSGSTCSGLKFFAALNDRKIALEAQGRTLYNLSVGTPDFPPAPHIKQALLDAPPKTKTGSILCATCLKCWTPSAGITSAGSGWRGSPGDKVMSVSGSQDGIGHLGLALLNDGDTVLLPDPCYPVFMTGMRLGGGVPWFYTLTRENRFLPDVHAIPAEIARKAKVMLVSLPANRSAASARRNCTAKLWISAKI